MSDVSVTVKTIQIRRSFTAGYRPLTAGAGALREGETLRNYADGVDCHGVGDGTWIETDIRTAVAQVKSGPIADALALLAPVSTVAALKAIPPQPGRAMRVTEAGRDGLFVWTLGDYSYPVSADPRNGVFVPATGVAAAVGAWVRAGWSTGSGVQLSWFGLTYADDTAAIQAALNFVSNLQTFVLFQGSQRLTFSAPLVVPAGVQVKGNGAGVWRQAAGANIADLITLGSGSALLDVGLDGNWGANANSQDTTHVAVRIGASNDTRVRGCRLTNCPGYVVVINGGQRNDISGNTISNFFDYAVQIYGTDGYDVNEIIGNTINKCGWGAIGLANSSGNIVANNDLTGTLIGGFNDKLVVNTSGSTVTWVSGPKFTTLRAGNFFVYANGKEARISKVVNDTQLTTYTTLDTLSNATAHAGAGDMTGVVQGSFNNFIGNAIRECATYGFGYSLSGSTANCAFNCFSNNTLSKIGKNAINYSATVFNGGVLQGNSADGNSITLAGCGGGNGDVDRIAIYLQGVGAGSIVGTSLRNNIVTSFSGFGQTSYWLGANNQVGAGTGVLSGNSSSGLAATGVFGGVIGVALSSAWGSAASVSGVVTDGRSVGFVISSNGTGQAVGGSIVVSKVFETSTDTPMPIAKTVSGSGNLLTLWGENQSTRGSWVAYQRDGGAPVAGQTYQIVMKD